MKIEYFDPVIDKKYCCSNRGVLIDDQFFFLLYDYSILKISRERPGEIIKKRKSSKKFNNTNRNLVHFSGNICLVKNSNPIKVSMLDKDSLETKQIFRVPEVITNSLVTSFEENVFFVSFEKIQEGKNCCFFIFFFFYFFFRYSD